MKLKLVFDSLSKDGCLWRTCHDIYPFVFTITMRQVRCHSLVHLTTSNAFFVSFPRLIQWSFLQNGLTKQYSTRWQRICWTFAKYAVAVSVPTALFTTWLPDWKQHFYSVSFWVLLLEFCDLIFCKLMPTIRPLKEKKIFSYEKTSTN